MFNTTPASAKAAKSVTFADTQVACSIRATVTFKPPLKTTSGGRTEALRGSASGCTSTDLAAQNVTASIKGTLKASKIRIGCNGFLAGNLSGSLRLKWKGPLKGTKLKIPASTASLVSDAAVVDGSGDWGLVLPGSGVSKVKGGFPGTESVAMNSGLSTAQLAALCSGVGIRSVRLTGIAVLGATSLDAPDGTVDSVDGSTTVGTCGAAGQTGTFNVSAPYRTTFIVNVTAQTSFAFQGVTGPSFANVCVGDFVGANGTDSNATIKASQVFYGCGGGCTTNSWAGYTQDPEIICPYLDSLFSSPCGSVSAVYGSWVVPAVTCQAFDKQLTTNDGLIWVGIDGFPDESGYQLSTSGNQDTVEQTGTTFNCTNGEPSYGCFQEMFPVPANTNCPGQVEPGDNISAQVVAPGSVYGVPQVWQLTLIDSTQNWKWQSDITDAQVGSGFDPDDDTAEWFVEAPLVDNFIVATLPDFGSVTFFDASIDVTPTDQNGAPDGNPAGTWFQLDEDPYQTAEYTLSQPAYSLEASQTVGATPGPMGIYGPPCGDCVVSGPGTYFTVAYTGSS